MTDRPRLLDLFCGAGGAARGYQHAGFHVTGVDIKPQPRYAGNTFVLGDALAFLERYGHEFDAIHASPPCQAYSPTRHLQRSGHQKQYPDLIAPVRELLIRSGRPYIIENVPGAPLLNPVRVCGSVLGLAVRRHRYFESNIPLVGTPCDHERQGQPIGVYGKSGSWSTKQIQGGERSRRARTTAEARWAMGMSWGTRYEVCQAIPPAYTEYLGTQLYQYLEERETAA